MRCQECWPSGSCWVGGLAVARSMQAHACALMITIYAVLLCMLGT